MVVTDEVSGLLLLAIELAKVLAEDLVDRVVRGLLTDTDEVERALEVWLEVWALSD